MEGNVAEIRRDNLVFNYVEHDDYFALTLRIRIVRNGIQMSLNLLLCQACESTLGSNYLSDLNLVPTKVTAQNRSQARDCSSNHLIRTGFLQISLFQKVHGLLFLWARSSPEKGQKVSRTVHLVNNRSFDIVHPDKAGNHRQRSKGSHLRFDLRQIRHARGNSFHRARVAIVVCPFSGFLAGPLHKGLAISHGACHADANSGCNLKQMSDTVRLHESIWNFLLRYNSGGIFAADRHDGKTRVGCFKAVFHLVQTPLRGKDGNVVIIIAVKKTLGEKTQQKAPRHTRRKVKSNQTKPTM